MTPVDQSVVDRKLTQIAERLRRLERYAREGWAQYRRDFERKKTTEKLLQEIIEAAIDLNTHLLVEEQGEVPKDYFASFVNLGNLGRIPPDLAEKLAPSAGLRNRLVHLYSEIDDRKIFDMLPSAVDLFARYVKAIRASLKG